MREQPPTSTGVEKNGTDSPPLRPLGEIRNQIYENIFGNQHIECFCVRAASLIIVHNNSSYTPRRDGPMRYWS